MAFGITAHAKGFLAQEAAKKAEEEKKEEEPKTTVHTLSLYPNDLTRFRAFFWITWINTPLTF